MSFARIAIVLVSLVVIAHGCGGTKECSSDSDCDSSQVCAFPTNGGCGAKGTCASWDNPCDGVGTQACDCLGQPIEIACGYPGSPKPIANVGACIVPSGGPCNGPDDCDPRALCAFPIADGCSAKGTCVLPDARCDRPGATACACDGTPVGLACIYGQGNAPAPVMSTSPCPTPDGGGDAASDAPIEAATDGASDAAGD